MTVKVGVSSSWSGSKHFKSINSFAHILLLILDGIVAPNGILIKPDGLSSGVPTELEVPWKKFVKTLILPTTFADHF